MTTTRTLCMPANTHELILERVLDAPVENLWRCWTEATLLKQWFCPQPWSVSRAIIDARPGGEFSIVMHGPEGEEFPASGVFLAVEPRRRLVTTDAFLPGWVPSERAFMTTEVSFARAGDNRTQYTAIVRHWTAEAKAEHEAMGFHEGWGKATDQLAVLAKSL